MSRCVVCLDCIDNCTEGAIRYKFVGFGNGRKPKAAEPLEPADKSRRTFLTTTVIAGTALAAQAQNKRLDGGLATVIDKQVPERRERLVPPGAQGVGHFYGARHVSYVSATVLTEYCVLPRIWNISCNR